MKKILFQGDSITDCGRDRTNNELIGSGYACLVKANMMFEYPTEYRFFNRGINGNRSVDLYARIKSDIINLQPDYISFLIGVNDVWQEIGSCNGVSAEKYEKIYGEDTVIGAEVSYPTDGNHPGYHYPENKNWQVIGDNSGRYQYADAVNYSGENYKNI